MGPLNTEKEQQCELKTLITQPLFSQKEAE